MKHDLQVEIIKELFDQIDNNKNVDAGVIYKNPTNSYTDPEIAAKEWDTLFKNHPQLVGLSDDLPKAGSFFTCDDFGTPILATRDDSGKFNAFVNACRHRGVQVTQEHRGESKRFVCPFHAWTYKNNGELSGIPQNDHFGNIDKSCHNLIPLPAVEKYGMLWVHPQPEGTIDFDELFAGLDEELEALDLSKYVYCDESSINKELNWKFANDTFGETYHFQKLHKSTLGTRFQGDNLSYQTFGRNHRFVFASKSIEFMRNKPESEWRLSDGSNIIYYLFPNIQLNFSGASIALVRIYPDANNAGRSVTRITHYFNQQTLDFFANQEKSENVKVYDASNVYDGEITEDYAFSVEAQIEIFNSTVANEDYAMGEVAQRVAESGALEHVVFGRNEAPLHHYHKHFRQALNLPPLEKVET